MPYMSYFERKFRDEGRQEGLQEGLQEGRQEGLQSLLALQLQERFGALPKEVRERLADASDTQLVAWAKALLRAQSVDEVFSSR